jgi:hypothetical protein
MNAQERIKSLTKEAELYRAQGLLKACKSKYVELWHFVSQSERLRKQEGLVEAVETRLRMVQADMEKIGGNTGSPELSGHVQDLIAKLFVFSQDENAAAIEAAVALAKFGQYDRALQEFRQLLRKQTLPLLAAKNILRCHLARSDAQGALEEFAAWRAGDLLPHEQLRQVRRFLENLLKKKGLKMDLPDGAETAAVEKDRDETKEEDLLDISSVRIRFEQGPMEGNVTEFDVTFQSGNVISVVVSAKQEELVGSFEVGTRLKDVQLYSPIAIFRGNGTVAGKTIIKSGPKQGDYMMDIRIDSM